MSRWSFYKKYHSMLDMATPSIENRQKFKSTQDYYNAMNKARSYISNESNYAKGLRADNPLSWRSYRSIQRYNSALFLRLLMKIFITLAPLIIISVILSKDGDFHFDFFQFVNRFANLQLNFSKPLLDFIKSCSTWSKQYLALNAYADGFWEQFLNILRVAAQIGVGIFQILSGVGLIFTFLADFFANVMAFLGALLPGLV